VTLTKGTVAVVTPAPNNTNLTAGSTIQHKVVVGEWLWQIARCYGADPAKTIQANPQLADPRRISPDMIVTVPNIGSAGRIYGPPCVGTHTVQAGETWASIAQKYNADALVLQIVNGNDLTVGRVLKVPLNSAGAAQPAK
jgi:LysM repeat protein